MPHSARRRRGNALARPRRHGPQAPGTTAILSSPAAGVFAGLDDDGADQVHPDPVAQPGQLLGVGVLDVVGRPDLDGQNRPSACWTVRPVSWSLLQVRR
jgi:hypothetical protein